MNNWAHGGTHHRMGTPGNEARVEGRTISTGLELHRASTPNATWTAGHMESEIRTGRELPTHWE